MLVANLTLIGASVCIPASLRELVSGPVADAPLVPFEGLQLVRCEPVPLGVALLLLAPGYVTGGRVRVELALAVLASNQAESRARPCSVAAHDLY